MVDLTDRVRILLAEDDSHARSSLAGLLTACGHTVIAEAATGRDAVTFAAQLSPDVALLDVHLPDLSGLEAAQEIHRLEPRVAIVLYSGDDQLTLSERDVLTTPAMTFLPKPAPAKVIDSTLRLAVSRTRELAAARREAGEARAQLAHRKLIERAKGILMRRTRLSEPEAAQLLERASLQRGVSVAEIAGDVLASEPAR